MAATNSGQDGDDRLGAEREDQATGVNHYMPKESDFMRRLQARHRRGTIGRLFYYFSIGVAGLALIALFFNIVNEAFGTIGVVNTIEPETLTDGHPLEALGNLELAMILAENVGGRLRVLIRDAISKVDVADFTSATVAEIVGDQNVDPAIANDLLKAISVEQQPRCWRNTPITIHCAAWCWKMWWSRKSSRVSHLPIPSSISRRENRDRRPDPGSLQETSAPGRRHG